MNKFKAVGLCVNHWHDAEFNNGQYVVKLATINSYRCRLCKRLRQNIKYQALSKEMKLERLKRTKRYQEREEKRKEKEMEAYEEMLRLQEQNELNKQEAARIKREKQLEDDRIYKRHASANLTDYYIKKRFVSNTTHLTSKDIPQDIIETQRLLMQFKRAVKQLKDK
jgi:hypothetical protein